ncbi:MAG: hypothetical protein IGS23_24550 [Rivularia sp. T60_A2020_040]|nr:hypothetical protein [Rivularia sp. T60_A2020_040]
MNYKVVVVETGRIAKSVRELGVSTTGVIKLFVVGASCSLVVSNVQSPIPNAPLPITNYQFIS